MSATPIDVANYFLAEHRHEHIEAWRLNLLVAFTQAHALGVGHILHEDGRLGLFDEDMVASPGGPVIPSLNTWYEEQLTSGRPIRHLMMSASFEPFDLVEKFVLLTSNDYYWEMDTATLAEKALREFPGPWGTGAVIPKEAIYEAFKEHPLTQFCIGDKEEEGPEPEVTPEMEAEVRAMLGI